MRLPITAAAIIERLGGETFIAAIVGALNRFAAT
jgi:hypothetical protein